MKQNILLLLIWLSLFSCTALVSKCSSSKYEASFDVVVTYTNGDSETVNVSGICTDMHTKPTLYKGCLHFYGEDYACGVRAIRVIRKEYKEL